MEIIERKTTEIHPYEGNPRDNEAAIPAVMESIRQFGFKVPIIIDENDVIIAGHTRLKAAERLGMNTVPCIKADDLTPEQVKAFRIADNKTAELSTWDFEALNVELSEIEDIDMSAFGFDMSEIEDIPEPEDDDYEEPEEIEPTVQRGQVWVLGEHRLMCGDATSKEDVAELMRGGHAEIAFTDPPYGISIVKSSHKVGGDKPITIGNVHGDGRNIIVQHANFYEPVIGDETVETAQKNYKIIKDISDNQIIFGGNHFTDFLSPSRCWLVWDKENSGTFADAELAWTSFDKTVKIYRFMWNGLVRKGDRKDELTSRIHPTQKPVGLFSEILNDFTENGDAIIDCFGGSGTTLIACEKMQRKCYMMEIDPHYCDVIIDRWEQYTGGKAELIDGNEKK